MAQSIIIVAVKFITSLLFFFVFLSPIALATPGAEDEALQLFEAMQKRILTTSQQVLPAVVHIEAILKVENMSVATTGSGILSDQQGHILTNNHVVEKAEKVTVILPGEKKKYSAEIIGTDKQTDLAVIKIKPDGKVKPARFGDSAKVKVGDWVIAIGNPYGLDGTVSFGIISAIQRDLSVGGLLNEFIQTDAMIDFGSSGGPLVNMRGEVVGVNSRGQGRGIGFTIPASTALDIRDKLIKEGNVERAWLGVSIQPLDRELAEQMGIPKVTGIIVNQVHDGSSAEKAGIKAGDVITHYDDQMLEAENEQDMRAVSRLIAQTKVGKKVVIKIDRDSQPKTLHAEMLRQPKMEGNEEESNLGFHIKEITKILLINERLQSKKGVYVSFVEPGTVADEGKLMRGDIIQRIDKTLINDLKDYQRMGPNLRKQKRILMRVLRGNDLVFLLLKNDRKKPYGASS